MTNYEPFDAYAAKYDDWFEKNTFAYMSELYAIREQLSCDNHGIEIGVGSGRFASQLDIDIGVDPSINMLKIANNRGVNVINAKSEHLPFIDFYFDCALMVTTLCFLDDIDTSFREVYRVLKNMGIFVIGLIEKNSNIGRSYQRHKNDTSFYSKISFYSVEEVISHLQKTGFGNFTFTQTLFHELSEIDDIETIKKGYGEGSFVVIGARK